MTPKDVTTEWWWHPRPVCEALLPIDPIHGNRNLNPVWSAEVLEVGGTHPGQTYRCVFKHLDNPSKLPIEIACALAGIWLGNRVPDVCLVRVKTSELPDVPVRLLNTPELLLFGASYVDQDSFYEQLATLDQDHALANAVWDSFCDDAPQAAKGAALDELITNFDRHHRNMRFDGKHWWLIDHDHSLMETHGQDLSTLGANFTSGCNQIAEALLPRRPNDHGMAAAAKAVTHNNGLAALAARVAQWTDADPAIQRIWQQTSLLLDLLHRRTPMLQAWIGARIHPNAQTPLLWTPPPPPPPASST